MSSQVSPPSWEPRADRPPLSQRREAAPSPQHTALPVGAGRVRAVAPRAASPALRVRAAPRVAVCGGRAHSPYSVSPPHRPTAAVPLARAHSDITRVQSAAAAPRSGPPARHARRRLVRERGGEAEGDGARAAVSRAVQCRDASGWQPGCHGGAAQVGTAVTAAGPSPAPRHGARLWGWER